MLVKETDPSGRKKDRFSEIDPQDLDEFAHEMVSNGMLYEYDEDDILEDKFPRMRAMLAPSIKSVKMSIKSDLDGSITPKMPKISLKSRD